MILPKPALTILNTLISAGPKPVTFQPERMANLALKKWRKVEVAIEQVSTAAISIADTVADYCLPLIKLIVSGISLAENRDINPFVEFAHFFPATTPKELPLLRIINYRICPKLGSTWVPQWRLSPSKFYVELTKQLIEEEASGWLYNAEHDTIVVVLFVQAKQDDATKPKRIPDAKDRNDAGDPNHKLLPSMEELMEGFAARKYWSKIDIADRYYNIRIEEDLE